ncbi:MAG: PD-(D/E)XK nuclease family protein [Clostridia bacterium]|nr:PD-(D/E)XK nuclease family protein [Clostridia bacterium]
MGINLILGPCGSGKTHTCIQQICKITEANTSRGRVIFVVPEQFSLTAENMLAESLASRGGFIGTEVLSFTRLSHSVLAELGTSSAKPLSTVAKIITLTDVLGDLKVQGKLTYYLCQADRSGFGSKLLSFISEAKRYGVTPQDLEDFASKSDNPARASKYQELSLIFEQYNRRIKQLGKDGDEDLTLLAQAIPNCSSLRNAQIWIDSFTDFSPAHMDIIRELALVCNQVTITIPMEAHNPENSLFRKGNNTWLAITEMCRKHRIPYNMTSLDQDMRHREGSQLSWLQSQYGQIVPEVYTGVDNNVHLTACSDPFMECTMVAEQILREVSSHNTRFGDIAVAAGAISDYAGIIQPIFEEYGIPYFFDSLDSISNSVLPLSLVSALHVVIDGGDISDRLFTFLRAGLTDLSDMSIDVLENYCIEHGIRYVSQWNKLSVEDNPELPDAVPYVQELILHLSQNFSRSMTPGDFALKLAQFMEKYLLANCQALMDAMSSDKSSPESGRRADQFKQIWAKVLQVLESLRYCTGDREYSPRQLISLLSSGLDASQVGSIPTGRDIVIISDINRMRSRSLPSVYIIGARDGQFPSVPAADGIIPDSERLALREMGITLAPTADQVIFDKEYEAYYALTISTERLNISYSCSSPQGAKQSPAYLLTWISNALNIKVMEGNVSVSGGTAFNRFIHALGANQSILNRIMANYSRIPYGDPDPIPETGLYAKLWNTFIKIPACARICTSIIAQHLRQRGISTLPNGVNPMSLMGQVIPVTTLEEYGACPYRCYLNRVLTLKERRECTLNSADLGSIVHDLLCIGGRKLTKQNLWVSIDSVLSARNFVEPLLDEVLASPKYHHLMGNFVSFHGKNYISTATSAALYVCAREFADSGYRPREFELLFSAGRGIQPISVTGEKGTVYLSGKIDRVDMMETPEGSKLRVMDYKTGSVKLVAEDIYYGTSLQLPLYLKGYWDYMVSAGQTLDPRSMGYMSLTDFETTQKVLNPDLKTTQNALYKDLKPNVMVHDDELKAGDHKVTIDIPEIIGYTSHVAGEFGDKILEGNFPIKPLDQDSCKYCQYKNICAKDVLGCTYGKSNISELDMAMIINGHSLEQEEQNG